MSSGLLSAGKLLRKDGKSDDAIEMLARACEAKMNEEGTEIFGELADYLIEYADVLLCKEEANSSDFLGGGMAGAGDGDSDEGEGTTARLDSGRLDQPPADQEEEEVLTDLQLAWESFEHARLCLLTRDNSVQRSKELSFVHCRLGDIQALQDQFEASIADYGESVEQALKADEAPRKVAGLLVSLSQTVQVFIMSEESKSGDIDLDAIISKFNAVFKIVAAKFECTTPESSGIGLAMVARDGFLLAHALLQSVKDDKDVVSTMAELSACAEDCLHQEAEVAATKLMHGVAQNGFALSSGAESSANVVTVTVKRKAVTGEDDRPDAATELPLEKKAKESPASLQRADKAKLVD